MFKNHWDRFWPLVAGVILVLFFLAAIFGDSFFQVVCGNRGDCARVREWIGALSGWVAAAAAGGTIYVLLDQMRIQRKQLDFQLGDAEPTIEAFPSDRPSRSLIRVVNWNRRTMNIVRIDMDAAYRCSRGFIHYGHKQFQEQRYDGGDLELVPPIRLLGWENRAEGPQSVQIEFILFTARADGSPREMKWREAMAKVHCRQFGDVERAFTLDAKLLVHTY